ncbi:hypothetical protein GCM10028807_08800 [Spirosoma daeguense]
MNTTRTRVIAFVFAGMLILPVLDKLLGLSNRFTSTENRAISNRPALHFPHVRTFVKQFDQYYKENFGWRNALFYVYSRWKFKILGTSPLPEKVVVGKNGWFYLGNNYNRVVDQHRGVLPLSADSARIIATHLTLRQQELAHQGIRLYVLIAPDSHSIYPENLPDHLQPSPNPSRLDVLRQAMASTTVPFLDIRDTLRSAKSDYIVYNQTDTHWNDYGTLVGCAALLTRIREDFPTVPPVRIADYHIEKQKGGGGDLVTMLTLQQEIKDPVFYYITFPEKLEGRKLATVPNERFGFPSTRLAGSGTNRLLLIGDSFSHSMMHYLPGYFEQSFFVRDDRLDPAVLKSERPNIIVVEVVERNINKLATL